MKKDRIHTVLFFELSVSGHHLEYIHHLYMGSSNKINTRFIFALPKEFLDVKDKLEWPSFSNIELHIFEDGIDSTNSVLQKSYFASKILKRVIKRFSVDEVFLISLMAFLPVLPFVISKKIKVSGIIYLIYLYRWKESSLIVRLQDIVKYLILSNMNIFDKIFILNDAASTRYFNRIYKTNKFHFLPDPFVPIDIIDVKDLRKEMNIEKGKKVFLHFGSMSSRKGTLDIIEAIRLLSDRDLERMCFVFAGKVGEDISEAFYEGLGREKQRTQIIVYDEFCDYSFLGSLCETCDYILIPYRATMQSSGIIGFAAQFCKPVIAPDENLLGRLVRRYDMGYLIRDTNPNSLVDFMSDLDNSKLFNMSMYIKDNNVQSFISAIFEGSENY